VINLDSIVMDLSAPYCSCGGYGHKQVSCNSQNIPLPKLGDRQPGFLQPRGIDERYILCKTRRVSAVYVLDYNTPNPRHADRQVAVSFGDIVGVMIFARHGVAFILSDYNV
jgi:hypothetical protein